MDADVDVPFNFVTTSCYKKIIQMFIDMSFLKSSMFIVYFL